MSLFPQNLLSAENSTFAVRKASGRCSALLIIALFTATALSYEIWGLDLLLFYLTGRGINVQLYQILASILPTVLGAVASVFAARKFTGYRVKTILVRPQIHFKAVLLGFGLCMGLNLVTSLLSNLLTQWLNHGGITVNPPDFSYSPESPFFSAVLLLYACVIAPTLEELIFRGYILRFLQRFGNGFAILFSSLLFAFYHFDLTQLLPAFVMGCLFGYLAVRCESVLPVIVIHVLNNVVAISLSTFSPVLSPTAILAINAVLYALAIVSLIVALSMHRKNLWKLQRPALEGQLTAGKTFGAAFTSPIWILCVLVYLYQVITKIIAF